MGFVLGAIVPVLGYICMEQIVNFLGSHGILEDIAGEGLMRRFRTVGLIAICFNLIPFEYCRKFRLDDTMRGIVFPTIIYVGFWVYKYYNILFA